MTPDSRKDNIFCKDNNSHKVNCEDDTHNGDSEDDRDYDLHKDDCEDDTRNSNGEDDHDDDGSRDPRLPRGRRLQIRHPQRRQ